MRTRGKTRPSRQESSVPIRKSRAIRAASLTRETGVANLRLPIRPARKGWSGAGYPRSTHLGEALIVEIGVDRRLDRAGERMLLLRQREVVPRCAAHVPVVGAELEPE